MTGQQNTDRILTTHVGSLPRPHDLLDMMKARLAGLSRDEAERMLDTLWRRRLLIRHDNGYVAVGSATPPAENASLSS